MLKMNDFRTVRECIDQGMNNSQIARKLGVDRGTVRKYRATNTPPKYPKRIKPTRKDPCEAFAGQIRQIVEDTPKIKSRVVYDLLKEKGYSGSVRSIQRVVSRNRELHQNDERYFEQSYELGEQCQVDFKEKVTLKINGVDTICHLFVAKLPASGKHFIKAFPNKTYFAFADGTHSFFEHIGGVPRALRFDNLSPVVRKVLPGNKRLYTKAFERLKDYYGFECLPCRPGKGSDKGSVERQIQTVSGHLFDYIAVKDMRFQDIHELNAFLETYSDHFMTDKSKGLFEEEKKSLRSCPQRDEAVLCETSTCRVSKWGTILAAGSRYSVPDRFIGKSVKIVSGAFNVIVTKLLSEDKETLVLPRLQEGSKLILLEHTIGSLVRKPGAMVRWSHKAILFPDSVFEKFYEYVKKRCPENPELNYLKCLNLIHHTSLSELRAGVQLIIESKSKDPFGDLEDLIVGRGHQPTQPINQSPLNPDLSVYDNLIPSKGSIA